MRAETVSIILLGAQSWSDNVDGFTFTIDSSIKKPTSNFSKRARVVAFEEKNDFMEDDRSISIDDLDPTSSLQAAAILDGSKQPGDSEIDIPASTIESNTNVLIDGNEGVISKLNTGEFQEALDLESISGNIMENMPKSLSIASQESDKNNVLGGISEKLAKDIIFDLSPEIFDSQSKISAVSEGAVLPENSSTELKSAADLTRNFLKKGSIGAADLTRDFLKNASKNAADLTSDLLSSESKSAGDITRDFLNNESKNAVDITRDFLNGQPNIISDEDTVTMAADKVEAILKVSQEAVEAAEATLPEDVSESIPLIPVQDNLNDTIGMDSQILPAEEVVGKAATLDKDNDFPSVARIMVFAASATGVFLCSPLLSLIDTSAVGLLSGTAQQAALNPGVAVTDYAALLIAFLYTGATNLVAAAREKDRGDDEKPVTTSSLTTVLQLSSYVGSILGLTLFVFARPLLKSLIGNDSINGEVFSAAMKYVRIRALGMPAAAVIGSAQAGCLGMQDIRSPLYVLATAALINLLGDTIFVGMKNPWIGGAAGAAWATVFSQYAAAYFFMKWLCTKPKKKEMKNVNISNAIMELTGHDESQGKGRRRRFNEAIRSFAKSSPHYLPAKSLASKVASVTRKLVRPKSPEKVKDADRFSTRGFLEGKFRSTDLLRLPKREEAKKFAPFVLPVTTTQLGRVSAYVAMSHVVSSTLGTAAMAAQQVIVSLFYCLTPIADSLSLTAQSIVPSIAERSPSRGRTHALRESMKNFYKAGGIFGMAMVSAALAIPLLSRFFTTDPGVAALVNSVAPLLVGFFGVHGIFMSSEGLLLAQKDLGFIGKMYACFFFAVPYFMLRVKKAALAGNSAIDLTSVWSVFIIYQFVRFVAFLARTFQIQRRSNLAAEEAEAKMSL